MQQRWLRPVYEIKGIFNGFSRMKKSDMKMRILIGVLLIVISLGYLFYSSYNSHWTNNSIQTVGGVHRIMFQYTEGNIFVFVPSDVSVGDAFILGGIEIQPNGNTDLEQGNNRNALSRKNLKIGDAQFGLNEKIFSIKNLTDAHNFEVKIIDNELHQSRSVNVPLLDEQPPQPVNFRLPLLVKAGDLATVIGPMGDGVRTHLTIGNSEAQLVVKSPRQSTFKVPDMLGLQTYELVENDRYQSGQINVAKLSMKTLNLASAFSSKKNYRWALEGLDGLSDAGYPITILFENRNAQSSAEEMTQSTVSITKEEVMNGRAEGQKEINIDGEITASLLGADIFSRGMTGRSPWSVRIHSSDATSQNNFEETQVSPKLNTEENTTPDNQSTTNPTGCQDVSKTSPTQCQSQGQPGYCLSQGQPRTCHSYKTPSGGFEPCVSAKGADGKYDGCVSQNYPDACLSQKDPTKCPDKSTQNPSMCVSEKQPKECSQGTPPRCHSTKTPSGGLEPCVSFAGADGKYDGCVSQRQPKLCPNNESQQNPLKCTSAKAPTNACSIGNPPKCESTQAPNEGFKPCQSAKIPGGYDGCLSQRNPKLCPNLSKQDPKQCPPDKSTQNPSWCISEKKPKECSQGTPPRCHSSQTPNGFEPCVSFAGADGKYDGCVSQLHPDLCPNSESQQNPLKCTSAKSPTNACSVGNPPKCESTQAPNEGFTPCQSAKIPGDGYDGCLSQRNPKLCPNLSKQDPTQCPDISKQDPKKCYSQNEPKACTDLSKTDPRQCRPK